MNKMQSLILFFRNWKLGSYLLSFNNMLDNILLSSKLSLLWYGSFFRDSFLVLLNYLFFSRKGENDILKPVSKKLKLNGSFILLSFFLADTVKNLNPLLKKRAKSRLSRGYAEFKKNLGSNRTHTEDLSGYSMDSDNNLYNKTFEVDLNSFSSFWYNSVSSIFSNINFILGMLAFGFFIWLFFRLADVPSLLGKALYKKLRIWYPNRFTDKLFWENFFILVFVAPSILLFFTRFVLYFEPQFKYAALFFLSFLAFLFYKPWLLFGFVLVVFFWSLGLTRLEYNFGIYKRSGIKIAKLKDYTKVPLWVLIWPITDFLLKKFFSFADKLNSDFLDKHPEYATKSSKLNNEADEKNEKESDSNVTYGSLVNKLNKKSLNLVYSKALIVVSMQKFLVLKKQQFLKRIFLFKQTFYFSKKHLVFLRLLSDLVHIILSPFIFFWAFLLFAYSFYKHFSFGSTRRLLINSFRRNFAKSKFTNTITIVTIRWLLPKIIVIYVIVMPQLALAWKKLLSRVSEQEEKIWEEVGVDDTSVIDSRQFADIEEETGEIFVFSREEKTLMVYCEYNDFSLVYFVFFLPTTVTIRNKFIYKNTSKWETRIMASLYSAFYNKFKYSKYYIDPERSRQNFLKKSILRGIPIEGLNFSKFTQLKFIKDFYKVYFRMLFDGDYKKNIKFKSYKNFENKYEFEDNFVKHAENQFKNVYLSFMHDLLNYLGWTQEKDKILKDSFGSAKDITSRLDFFLKNFKLWDDIKKKGNIFINTDFNKEVFLNKVYAEFCSEIKKAKLMKIVKNRFRRSKLWRKRWRRKRKKKRRKRKRRKSLIKKRTRRRMKRRWRMRYRKKQHRRRGKQRRKKAKYSLRSFWRRRPRDGKSKLSIKKFIKVYKLKKKKKARRLKRNRRRTKGWYLDKKTPKEFFFGATSAISRWTEALTFQRVFKKRRKVKRHKRLRRRKKKKGRLLRRALRRSHNSKVFKTKKKFKKAWRAFKSWLKGKQRAPKKKKKKISKKLRAKLEKKRKRYRKHRRKRLSARRYLHNRRRMRFFYLKVKRKFEEVFRFDNKPLFLRKESKAFSHARKMRSSRSLELTKKRHRLKFGFFKGSKNRIRNITLYKSIKRFFDLKEKKDEKVLNIKDYKIVSEAKKKQAKILKKLGALKKKEKSLSNKLQLLSYFINDLYEKLSFLNGTEFKGELKKKRIENEINGVEKKIAKLQLTINKLKLKIDKYNSKSKKFLYMSLEKKKYFKTVKRKLSGSNKYYDFSSSGNIVFFNKEASNMSHFENFLSKINNNMPRKWYKEGLNKKIAEIKKRLSSVFMEGNFAKIKSFNTSFEKKFSKKERFFRKKKITTGGMVKKALKFKQSLARQKSRPFKISSRKKKKTELVTNSLKDKFLSFVLGRRRFENIRKKASVKKKKLALDKRAWNEISVWNKKAKTRYYKNKKLLKNMHDRKKNLYSRESAPRLARSMIKKRGKLKERKKVNDSSYMGNVKKKNEKFKIESFKYRDSASKSDHRKKRYKIVDGEKIKRSTWELYRMRSRRSKLNKKFKSASRLYKRTRLNKVASKVFRDRVAYSSHFLKNLFRSMFGFKKVDIYENNDYFVDLKKAKKKSSIIQKELKIIKKKEKKKRGRRRMVSPAKYKERDKISKHFDEEEVEPPVNPEQLVFSEESGNLFQLRKRKKRKIVQRRFGQRRLEKMMDRYYRRYGNSFFKLRRARRARGFNNFKKRASLANIKERANFRSLASLKKNLELLLINIKESQDFFKKLDYTDSSLELKAGRIRSLVDQLTVMLKKKKIVKIKRERGVARKRMGSMLLEKELRRIKLKRRKLKKKRIKKRKLRVQQFLLRKKKKKIVLPGFKKKRKRIFIKKKKGPRRHLKKLKYLIRKGFITNELNSMNPVFNKKISEEQIRFFSEKVKSKVKNYFLNVAKESPADFERNAFNKILLQTFEAYLEKVAFKKKFSSRTLDKILKIKKDSIRFYPSAAYLNNLLMDFGLKDDADRLLKKRSTNFKFNQGEFKLGVKKNLRDFPIKNLIFNLYYKPKLKIFSWLYDKLKSQEDKKKGLEIFESEYSKHLDKLLIKFKDWTLKSMGSVYSRLTRLEILEPHVVYNDTFKREVISKTKRSRYYKASRDSILKSYSKELFEGPVIPKNWLIKNIRTGYHSKLQSNSFFEKKKMFNFYNKKKIKNKDVIIKSKRRRRNKRLHNWFYRKLGYKKRKKVTYKRLRNWFFKKMGSNSIRTKAERKKLRKKRAKIRKIRKIKLKQDGISRLFLKKKGDSAIKKKNLDLIKLSFKKKKKFNKFLKKSLLGRFFLKVRGKLSKFSSGCVKLFSFKKYPGGHKVKKWFFKKRELFIRNKLKTLRGFNIRYILKTNRRKRLWEKKKIVKNIIFRNFRRAFYKPEYNSFLNSSAFKTRNYNFVMSTSYGFLQRIKFWL